MPCQSTKHHNSASTGTNNTQCANWNPVPVTNSDIIFEFAKKRTSDFTMPKAKSTSKKSSRKMTIYRKPRDMDIFKPVTTKLVYTDTILLSSTGSVAFNTHTFRANSVFDPDWTGAGHQPTRFDQLAALYQRYEVLKSKIRVQFTTGQLQPTSTTVALGPWHVGVVCSGQATPAGSGTDPGYTLAESPRSDHGALCEAMVKTCKTVGP